MRRNDQSDPRSNKKGTADTKIQPLTVRELKKVRGTGYASGSGTGTPNSGSTFCACGCPDLNYCG